MSKYKVDSMPRTNKVYALVPLGVLRRMTLAQLGFTYEWQGGVWRRRAVVIQEDSLDAMSERQFSQRVRHWVKTGRRGRPAT
jgi:hypothetical protein